MTATIRRWSLLSCLGLVLSLSSVAFAAELRDGPVMRGTRVEELKAQRGEPVNVVASQGEGVAVERWYYPEKLVVVIQDGFVIDSFVEN